MVETLEKKLSSQIKINYIHEIMQVNLEKLYVQRVFSRPHNISPLCWASYCVNDKRKWMEKFLKLCVACFVTII